MNNQKYRWILYFIVFVVFSTVIIQVYWNYKNYISNKKQLVNDVQLSLDNAVETYFANLIEAKTLALTFDAPNESHIITNRHKLDSIVHSLKLFSNAPTGIDSLKLITNGDLSSLEQSKTDTINEKGLTKNFLNHWKKNKIIFKKLTDSVSEPLDIKHFRRLTSKVIISMVSDSLKLDKIDSILQLDFSRKQLNIDYGLSFKNISNKVLKINQTYIDESSLVVTSKSPFLPRQSELKIHFTNDTQIILKRILLSILISILLVLAVISCLFYLLKIIKHQKQLAEVKNDLISNITHEFKTPIATIGVAIESIKNFNVIDNKEKTERYLDMSNDQLSKLNTMVEKLLETATLDSDNIKLNKEEANIIELIKVLVEKYTLQIKTKSINLSLPSNPVNACIDVFHFENAVNNLLDNAMKYGGNTVDVGLTQNSTSFTISINDNGNTLNKSHKEQIFEKFYRVPTGNKHDIKGFGIGLYYTKKIIEKHGGFIQLDLKKDKTTFIITVPNG
ncbi:HAMP domain-containing sensor histidine kinase [Tamlana sp. 2201CG12-4]|uniref:sensor histidine kinase n=1 Tax=Tamlana sp. 2201CG12-4 TaxID=3112582 RepID=UPI002DBD3D5E|nr:HAMP domain-containing sensor histidine kinase [Tamlana sp. 2201CG12-4]MEC3907648.1 HAMP domain-containing sensor histidine kinase [Tamlana sp. 2201CG12-4]